jgi:hypothetical protein
MSENKERKIEMSITETEPIIKKVVMVDGGRKGLEVTYHSAEKRNDVISQVDTNKKQKRPVQKELREAFVKLREHTLRCCGYYWANDKQLDMFSTQIIVTYVLIDKMDRFQLGGKRTVLGNYTIAINSPLVSVDDYKESESLMELIDTIRKETALFMKGLKGADERQVTIDHMTVKKGITNAEEAYASMSQAEIDEITREALEESGLEIIHEGGEQVITAKEDSKQTDNQEVEELKSIPVVTELIEDEPPFIEPAGNDYPDESHSDEVIDVPQF